MVFMLKFALVVPSKIAIIRHLLMKTTTAITIIVTTSDS